MSVIDVKVVLLGREYGGKTSLVERYIHQRFIERSGRVYQATIGAAYACRKLDIKGTIVNLSIWDTAGSERYEALSRMYFRAARAAIIAIDISDSTSFEKAKFWSSELKLNEENCRIYLCATKCDLLTESTSSSTSTGQSSTPNTDRKYQTRPKIQVNLKELYAYANAIGASVFKTSSKTGEGVDELFYRIAKDYLDYHAKFELEQPFQSKEKRIDINRQSKKSSCCF